MTPYTLQLEIVGLPKTGNQRLRGHWRVNHAHTKKWKNLVAQAVRFQVKPPQPLTSAALELVRVSSVEPDFDNLVTSFKAVVDSLVECGVLASDKPSCVGQPKYHWEKGSKGHGKIKVKVVANA